MAGAEALVTRPDLVLVRTAGVSSFFVAGEDFFVAVFFAGAAFLAGAASFFGAAALAFGAASFFAAGADFVGVVFLAGVAVFLVAAFFGAAFFVAGAAVAFLAGAAASFSAGCSFLAVAPFGASLVVPDGPEKLMSLEVQEARDRLTLRLDEFSLLYTRC